MSAKVSWYKRGQIVLWERMEGETLADVQQADREILNLLESVRSNTVYVMQDVSNLTPEDIKNAVDLRETYSYHEHPRLAMVVIYGAQSSLVENNINFVTRSLQVRHQSADTRNEALAIIEEDRKARKAP